MTPPRNNPTRMALAFMDAKVKKLPLDHPFVERVLGVMIRYRKGLDRRFVDRGWSTNLSYRTYQQLKANGVLH